MIPKDYIEFNKQKEIPREVEVPELTDDQIRNISNTVFANYNPNKADIIFVFGSCDVNWEPVAKLYLNGFADKISYRFFR